MRINTQCIVWSSAFWSVPRLTASASWELSCSVDLLIPARTYTYQLPLIHRDRHKHTDMQKFTPTKADKHMYTVICRLSAHPTFTSETRRYLSLYILSLCIHIVWKIPYSNISTAYCTHFFPLTNTEVSRLQMQEANSTIYYRRWRPQWS